MRDGKKFKEAPNKDPLTKVEVMSKSIYYVFSKPLYKI